MATTDNANGALLKGKVAFITGAGQGIGLAVARAYAEQGAQVVLADIARDALEKAAATLADPRAALAIPLDVTDEAQTAQALKMTVERFGRVDCVVANAGILTLKHVVDLELAAWRKVIDVGSDGRLHYGAAVCAPAVESGNRRPDHIYFVLVRSAGRRRERCVLRIQVRPHRTDAESGRRAGAAWHSGECGVSGPDGYGDDAGAVPRPRQAHRRNTPRGGSRAAQPNSGRILAPCRT